jgi:hypothetical protein
MDNVKQPLTREERAKFLTPEYRQWFDGIDEDLVRFDVSNHRYKAPEKHYAALAWLDERRDKKEKQEATRHKVIAWLTGLTLFVAALGALFAFLALL